MMVIDEYQNNDQRKEQGIDIGRGGEIPLKGTCQENQACKEFNQRVLDRDCFLAEAAFPPQPEKSKERDIVICRNVFSALRAMGIGENDGFAPGNAINTDIQEAPDDQTQNKAEC